MQDDQKKEFAAIVRATCLACGGEAPEPDVLRIWWAALLKFEIHEVRAAFTQYVMHGKFPPKPADILQILDRIKPDGRPGADEAWAMIPHDEYASVVMTEEMDEAMHVAYQLIDAGDKVAARMAFKEAYTRIVDQNKLAGIGPKWFPSLGHDKEGRDIALAEAVRLGRLGVDHAIGLLPPEKVAPMLEAAGNKALAIEYKAPSKSEVLERIAKIKFILKGTK